MLVSRYQLDGGTEMIYLMARVFAFFRGVVEFRTCLTTHYDDYGLSLAYDYGRDLAHRCTFRRWDR